MQYWGHCSKLYQKCTNKTETRPLCLVFKLLDFWYPDDSLKAKHSPIRIICTDWTHDKFGIQISTVYPISCKSNQSVVFVFIRNKLQFKALARIPHWIFFTQICINLKLLLDALANENFPAQEQIKCDTKKFTGIEFGNV